METEVLAPLEEVQMLPRLSPGQSEVKCYLKEGTFVFAGNAST